MTIKIINKDFDKKRYNSVAIHPLQSWEWGEARQKMGIEVIRVGEFEDDKLINVFQLTFHKIPYTSFTVGYLPRSIIPSSEVLDFLQEEAKKRKAIFIKIEPYCVSSSFWQAEGGTSNVPATFDSGASRIPSKDSGVLAALVPRMTDLEVFQSIMIKSSHPLFPQWTQMIDLTKSEEELLKNMHPKTRYNIGLARKRGVVVKEMTNDEGFKIFKKLYFETCRRQHYRGHNNKYHEIIFDVLKGTISHIFIAFYNNTPLASYHVFTFNDVMYYVYGGSSLEHKNIMAPNLLMWEVIRFGQKNGFSRFDMWGSLGPDYKQLQSANPNRDWIGFTRFKEGYGGQFVEFVGSYDLVINPVSYQLYNIVDKLRRKIL